MQLFVVRYLRSPSIESDFLFEILTCFFVVKKIIMLTNTQANHILHKQIGPRSSLFSQNIYKLCAIFILLTSSSNIVVDLQYIGGGNRWWPPG